MVVLNSNCAAVGGCGAGSAQVQWLEDDLGAHSDQACTLAYFHHPRFSSSTRGNNSAMVPFWDALYEAGAEVVLNGHAHHYERFAPQTPGGQADPEGGISQFVVGTGGKSLNSFGTVQANSEVRLADADSTPRATTGSSSPWTAPRMARQLTLAAGAATVRPLSPLTARVRRVSQVPTLAPTPPESPPQPTSQPSSLRR